MKLIGITGKARSGKDTTADILVRDYGFVKIALADVLKRAVRTFFDFSEEQCWGDKKDEPDKRYARKPGDYLTPREALQKLGTEYGRGCHPDVWVEYLMRIVDQFEVGTRHVDDLTIDVTPGYEPRFGLFLTDIGAEGALVGSVGGIVIPDVRFDNEARAIIDRGGDIWRCNRRVADRKRGLWGSLRAYIDRLLFRRRDLYDHTSEAGISDFYVDLELDNNGSLEDLAAQISAGANRSS